MLYSTHYITSHSAVNVGFERLNAARSVQIEYVLRAKKTQCGITQLLRRMSLCLRRCVLGGGCRRGGG